MLYIQIRKAILKNPGITTIEIFKKFPQHHPDAIKDALNILVNSKFVEFRDSKYFPEAIAERASPIALSQSSPIAPTQPTRRSPGRTPRRNSPYFAKNLKIDHLAGRYTPRRSLRDEMLEYIEQNPGITAAQLAELLRCSQARVNDIGKKFAFASMVKIELLPDKDSRRLVRAYRRLEW